MTEMIKESVNSILIDTFEISKNEISPDKNLFTDLGFDSLDAIDLIIKFQNKFKIKPEEEELKSIQTVSDVYLLVEKYAHISK